MKRIRAGFALDDSHRPRCVSVLRGKVTGKDADFLDRIDGGNDNEVIQPQAFVVHPVHQVPVISRL